MTVSAQTLAFEYAANGVTTTFPYGFRVLYANQVKVYVNGTLQVGGYTLTGVGDAGGGNVEFTVAPVNGSKVLVRRISDRVRSTDFQQAPYFTQEELLDIDQDYQTMLLQEAAADATNSLRIPPTETTGTQLPSAALRAGKFLMFDNEGDAVVSAGDTPTLASQITFLQAGTGAVARTAQAKMREVVSIKDFGAVGDGVANDSIAVQTAWDAIATAGGGVLYFPAGNYRINLVGQGSDNVSIVGDGEGSVLVSFNANDWAVKYDTGFPDGDLFVKDINFKDGTGAKTKHGLYVNTGGGLSIENVSFSGLGIGFCNNATFGFSFDSCNTSNNYVDYFSTCSTGANTAITNINGQTVQITDAFFPQHPGILVFKDCSFGGRVNHYYEQPDNPYNKEAAVQYINCTSVTSGGCGFYYTGAGWTHSVTMTQMWFEGSLGATPIRSITLPARYVYSNSCDITINNSFLGDIEITNDVICKLNNCAKNESVVLTASGRASFVGDNLIGDGNGGMRYDFFVQGARGHGAAGRSPYFHTTPKTNINRAYSGQKLASKRCFAADSLFTNFGAVQTKITTDSAFETLECFQIAASNGNGAYPFDTVALDNTKVYVITMALKATGAPFLLYMSTALGGFNVTIPTGRFQTYAIVGTPTTSGNDSPLMLNQTGSAQTWYVSGVQYLKFDNYSQVYEFLASSSFTL